MLGEVCVFFASKLACDVCMLNCPAETPPFNVGALLFLLVDLCVDALKKILSLVPGYIYLMLCVFVLTTFQCKRKNVFMQNCICC